MKIGTGKHTYEWTSDWHKLPPEITLGYTHGVVVDSRDNVYIHNQSKHAVIVLDREGNYIKSWGEDFAKGAHGLFLSREKDAEYLYLADYERHIVVKATLDGERIWTQGTPPRPDIYSRENEYKPTDVCVAPNGDIYVFDGYGKPWIHQYSNDGKYIRSIGGPGSEPGQLNCPHGGWIDTRRGEPELYVADRGNNRVQVFTLDGRHKRFLTDEMKSPCCFYQWRDELYIPHLLARLTVLDKDDRTIAILGDNESAPKQENWPNIQDKLQAGKFNSPHACCVDSRGDIYVVEWVSTGRITKLKQM